MPRKAAPAMKDQPDLLGGAPAAKPAPSPKSTAKVEPAKPKEKTALAVVEGRPPSVAEMLYKLTTNPKADPGVAKQYVDLYERLEAAANKRAFDDAFRSMMREMPIINKDGKIEIEGKSGKRGQLTRFATWENLAETIKPILDRHGFSLWHATEPSADLTRLLVTSYLEGYGHQRSTTFPLPNAQSGSQNVAQGWGASQSYGKRYNTVALLNIISKAKDDVDRDGAAARTKKGEPEIIDGAVVDEGGVPKITVEQHDKLVEAIEGCGATRKQFCGAWKIEKVADLAAEHFDVAMKACADRIKGAR